MIWVLLQLESPWQRNDAITFFIYLYVSLYQEYQGDKYSQFSPQILSLQVSVLIIHWHCFQVSYTRAHLAKR